MNEENNQNTPILGFSKLEFPSGTYKIKFTDEYYEKMVFPDNKLMKGRIMLLQNDSVNDGNYFVARYTIYDDVVIDEYVSHFDTEHIFPALGNDFYDEHTVSYMGDISDYQYIGNYEFKSTNEYHFVLDEEWYNKHYGDDSNKVLRTLAIGQSDITRHEAHTKAQGLNWANANAPKYVAADKFNGHEYVDLGLPSGTLWATMNVGATKETDYGLYFAWGETEGYTAEQVGVDKQFTWADYKFNPSGDGATFTKYNTTDNKVVLDSEDDAASVNMGGKWHMPTKTQCEELLNPEYVTSAWVTDYQGSGVNGRLFTSVSNGNTMFIPAAGYCEDGRVGGVGINGVVWASALDSEGVESALTFGFGSDGAGVSGSGRCDGQSVRGVIGELEGPLK